MVRFELYCHTRILIIKYLTVMRGKAPNLRKKEAGARYICTFGKNLNFSIQFVAFFLFY